MCQITVNAVQSAAKVVFPANPSTVCPTRLAQLLTEHLVAEGHIVGCTATQGPSALCEVSIKLAAHEEADRRQQRKAA